MQYDANRQDMYRNHKYRSRWSPLWVGLFIVLALVALSWVVMMLWNYAVQPIFGLPAMTLGQAAALLILCRILFGRLGPPQHKREYMRKRKAAWKEKWGKMSDEDRAAFRARWKEKCGPKRQANDRASKASDGE
ncbi:MAG: hypothetical protein AAFY48_17710 [Bacteroidota bacterium]